MNEAHRPPDGQGVGVSPASTGHSDVDAVLATLAGMVNVPAREQVARYTEAHRALSETLRAIDTS